MPNGAVWAQCWHCRAWTHCHWRIEREFEFWNGQWCEECYDWIDLHEDEWTAFHSWMCTSHQIRWRVHCTSTTHPLPRVFALEELASKLVSFIHDPSVPFLRST